MGFHVHPCYVGTEFMADVILLKVEKRQHP